MKYKIKEIGIDTRNLDTTFSSGFLEEKNLVTSPASGNDYILEPVFPEEGRLIVVMEKDINPSLLLYHLQVLHRERADVVLVDPKTKYLDDYIYLKEEAGFIVSLGLWMPENGGEIINFPYKQLGSIGIKISPLNFDLDILRYAEHTGLEVIGFCDDSNNLPHAFDLSFYGRYCNTVILEYDNYYGDKKSYLENLVNLEAPKEVEMTKTVKKKGKLEIGVSLKLGEDLILQCPERTITTHPEETVFGLGKAIENVPAQGEPEDEFEETVLELWNEIEGKEGYTREELSDLVRYLSVSFIRGSYNIGKISRYAFVIVAKKTGKKKKDVMYKNYLFYIKENKDLYLRNLQNTEETT